jgi:hypothetical protein
MDRDENGPRPTNKRDLRTQLKENPGVLAIPISAVIAVIFVANEDVVGKVVLTLAVALGAVLGALWLRS